MAKKTANQILAGNLARYMSDAGLSALALSKKAGVAANTIGNYLDTEPALTNTGKERSAKLAEVEKLADALGVTVVNLLEDGDRANLPPPPAGGVDDMLLLQLARDLAMLTPGRRSVLIDAIHQEAEAARELVEYHNRQANRTEAPAPSMAASLQSSARKTITIKRGDGNPDQGELSFSVLADPFTAQPSKRENQWYETLGPTKKPHGV